MKPIIIIGSGHAGITLAREIRAKDNNASVIVVTQENGDLYYKPNLSKALSMGKSIDALIMKTRDVLQSDFNIIIRSETLVTDVDTSQQTITVTNEGESERLAYASLVFATGASPINLGLTSRASDKVVSINNFEDYRSFISNLKKETRILIVGAGYVGCEFASDLSKVGHKIDVVDLSMWPLQRILPQSLGSKIVEAFPEDLVSWHFGTGIASLTESSDGVCAQLNSGTTITADIVLSAVGLSPNKSLAEKSGIKVHNGIVVDQYLKTSAENVYALGDCAEYYGCVLPFIAPATAAAKSLAQTLTGEIKKLILPPQAVAVKLAYCPLVICPPRNINGAKIVGTWQVEGRGADLSAVFYGQNGVSLGFALLGKATSQKNDLLKFLNEAPITS